MYGDIRALEIAKEIGADAVDFSTDPQSVSTTSSVYALSDDKIAQYYGEIGRYAVAALAVAVMLFLRQMKKQ